MKFGHINIVASDLDQLAQFYISVFGCIKMGARRRLSGPQLSKGNGLEGCEIRAARLSLPGNDGAFLEMFEYKQSIPRALRAVNEPGFGHLAFDVPDIHVTIAAVLEAGGGLLGQVTNLGTQDTPYLCIYLRDPEGNIIELEQC